MSSSAYDFVFRGLLTEEALDRAGRQTRATADLANIEIARALSIELMDDELVESAKQMAVVYTAIAAFENSARRLIANVLAEELGENWWTEGVSERIRRRADQLMEEEQRVKWHTQRGDDPINYTVLPDLSKVIRNNWECFRPYVHSAEWAASVFDVIDRSRNVIMHSGTLDREDIERVGINIRDWIKQVGA